MSERTLRLASAVLAALGAAISGYLLYVRKTGGELICSTGGCETVQSSNYAELLGIPVAAIGFAGFVGLLVTALAGGEWARLLQATLALSAFFFSGYLLYVQLGVIDAICQWCVATDALISGIAALALLRLRLSAAVPPMSTRSGARLPISRSTAAAAPLTQVPPLPRIGPPPKTEVRERDPSR
jgi:uncharacterized membrane protein